MTSSEVKPEMQQIEISRLSLPQLTQFKKHLDQEIALFQDSLQTLKTAQSKFGESKECLEKISPESEGTEIMVPLTGSMFVPGKIADSKKVLVDIGTDYFVNMEIEDAKEYFKRRVEFVTEQMEKIQAMGSEKNKLREAVVDLTEMKVMMEMEAMKESSKSGQPTAS